MASGTQVLVFAQQALYRLSSLSPQPKFCFVLFHFQFFFQAQCNWLPCLESCFYLERSPFTVKIYKKMWEYSKCTSSARVTGPRGASFKSPLMQSMREKCGIHSGPRFCFLSQSHTRCAILTSLWRRSGAFCPNIRRRSHTAMCSCVRWR